MAISMFILSAWYALQATAVLKNIDSNNLYLDNLLVSIFSIILFSISYLIDLRVYLLIRLLVAVLLAFILNFSIKALVAIMGLSAYVLISTCSNESLFLFVGILYSPVIALIFWVILVRILPSRRKLNNILGGNGKNDS